MFFPVFPREKRACTIFTTPPRISPGKINLVDTHREGDWTLEAVTGHGLQRLQQIACVKERTAINGCIIQYSVVVYTLIRVPAARVYVRRARARVCIWLRVRLNTRTHVCRRCRMRATMCVCIALGDVYVYVHIDSTARTSPRRKKWTRARALCTVRAAGIPARPERRLSCTHNPFARARDENDRAHNEGRRRMRAGAPPCSRFTFRRAFRRLDIALLQTPRAASAFDYCTTVLVSLCISFSLFLSPAPLSPLMPSYVHTCASFCVSLPSLRRPAASRISPPSLCRTFFSSVLSLLLYLSHCLCLYLSFLVSLLISLDRTETCSRVQPQ